MGAKRLLVTGGSGFIGSAFIRYAMGLGACEKIVNLDLLTYASNPAALVEVEREPRYTFILGTICDEELVEKVCREYAIDTIVHFAAESHVDRSIASPRLFLETNVGGTLSLLEVVRRIPSIHFHHISTDEVYGSLSGNQLFSEISPYQPNSPYSASKAASDHFVRAYAHTYGLSTTISHCSNNFGPYQHSEKLIPRIIQSCMNKELLPIYGAGLNVRDWLYVEDHAEAVWMILQRGAKGEVYDIGGECEKRNIDLVYELIEAFAQIKQESSDAYRALVTFVADRPGHDLRYAIDCSKIKKELLWTPRHSFSEGILKTIDHYISSCYYISK
jgi:dTDP-glucose 4,6-dehydratase